LARPGHFRPHLHPNLVEVWLRPNVYPFSFVALAHPRDESTGPGEPSNVLAFFAVGGKSGREGLTLQEAVQVLLTQVSFKDEDDKDYWVSDALLMDQGLDVFQFAGTRFQLPIEISYSEASKTWTRHLPGGAPQPLESGCAPLPEEPPDTLEAIGRDRLRSIFIVGEKATDPASVEPSPPRASRLGLVPRRPRRRS
jgi:hypothetical protein